MAENGEKAKASLIFELSYHSVQSLSKYLFEFFPFLPVVCGVERHFV